MIYGAKLKHYRERNNIKQKDITNKLNICKSLYSEYEQEIKTIPTKHLNTICNYLNLSFDYIFGFNENSQYLNSNFSIAASKLRLKEIREEENLSQLELGKAIGCSCSTISIYERGISLISVPALYRICSKYNISADYLLGKIDSPKYLNSTKK